LPETLKYIFIFALGACIGSFLNVCIYRLPLRKSLVSPPSSCPSCGSQVRFYDNIPIISYMALGGRCRQCRARISVEYPLVEALTALLAVGLYFKFALAPEFFVYFILATALVAVTFIDLEHRIIPDRISLPGIAVGLAARSLIHYPGLNPGLLDSLAGIALGGGLPFAIAVAYYFITGKEGLGGGDVKLLAMIGAFTGWKGAFFTLFAGSFAGAIIGIALMAVWGKKSKYAVPFGPFLAFGAVMYIFCGAEIINWYVSRMWSP